MGILKTLLVTTILVLPIGEIGRYLFPSIGSTTILLNDVLVGTTVSVWIGIMLRKRRFPSHTLLLPIFLFLGICTFSLLINSSWLTLSQMLTSFLYTLRWGFYAGLVFVVQDIGVWAYKRVFWLLVITGQIIVGIGYIQFFLYPSLGNLYYLGWDEHLYRMFSVFLDPNFAGIFFTCVFFLTCIPIREYSNKKQYGLALFLAIVALCDVGAVYLTYSRTALLTLLVGSVVILWLFSKKKFILLAFLFMFLGIFLFPKSFQTEGTNLLRIASAESRVATAGQAIEIIMEHPLVGVGFNAYRFAQYRYGYLSGKYWETSHGGSSTDNSYLFVLATTGIAGGAVYIFLLYRMILLCVGGGKITPLGIITCASIIGISISACFNNSWFYIFIMEWVWLLVGLVSLEKKNRE